MQLDVNHKFFMPVISSITIILTEKGSRTGGGGGGI